MGQVIRTLEGALGGALGAKVIEEELKAAQRLPEAWQPAAPRQPPGRFMAEQLDRVTGRRIPARGREAVAEGLHWAYGTFWGALFGLFSRRLRVRGWRSAVAGGAALGAAVWAVGYAGWLPATKLLPPIQRQGARHVTSDLLAHVGYGIVAALPLAFLPSTRR